MKLTRRQLRKLIMEHMIAPTFPAELSGHEEKIRSMIDSGNIENIKQADSLMKSFGYDNYVSQYLQNKHVGFAEKLGSKAGEIERQKFPYNPHMPEDEWDDLSQKGRKIDDELWRQGPDVAQQINPNFEKDDAMFDELLGRFERTKHRVGREPK